MFQHAIGRKPARLVVAAALATVAMTMSLPVAAHATGAVTRSVSVSYTGGDPTGLQNSDSTRPAASADGNLVVFSSKASDIVPNDTTHYSNVYQRNMSTATTTLVSVSTTGGFPNANSTFPDISADGRYVVFESPASNLTSSGGNGTPNVFRYDNQTQQTVLVSVAGDGSAGNAQSTRPTVSGDGRYVAFGSMARNLVPNDHGVGYEVYVRDMTNGTTTRASVGMTGQDPNGKTAIRPMISEDGTHLAFISDATNLVSIDTSGKVEVFERDLVNNVTTLVSVGADGVTSANKLATRPAINADGRYVAFQSAATNLVVGGTNGVTGVFRRDVVAGVTIEVSVSYTGGQLIGASTRAAIDGDGNLVAFASNDAHVVPGDTNGVRDVFFRDVNAGTNTLVSVNQTGGPGTCAVTVSKKACLATRPTFSVNGNAIVFVSTFTNLTSTATTGVADVFERTLS
jgi:hypothetical protein